MDVIRDETEIARLKGENARLTEEITRLQHDLTAAGVRGAQQALTVEQRHRSELGAASGRADRADERSLTLAAENAQLLADSGFMHGILESSTDCIKVLSLEGVLEFMSAGGQRVMEVDDTGRIYGCAWPDFWPGAGSEAARDAVAQARAGRTVHFQGAAPTAKGNERYWEVTVSPILGPDGAPTRLLSISRDISERKRHELERETLAGELHHRVMNTLAVVQAITSQTIRNARSLEDVGHEISSRVNALARAHGLLTGSGHKSARMSDVMANAIQPYDRMSSRFDLDGPDFPISPRASLALVLAINELCTNATKYGSLSVDDGRVEVRWWIDGETFRLAWKERGGPPVSAPSRRGFGSRLIDLNIKNQLGGDATIAYNAGGVCCDFVAPLVAVKAVD